ncbi:MAG: tetratricopeptide repeat protein [Gammaproteobacteria bacterium]
MSLLMDALRRAEEEKRRASLGAAPPDDNGSATITQELPAGRDRDAGTGPQAAAELQLEPIADDTAGIAREPSALDDVGIEAAWEMQPEAPPDKDSTLPSERAVANALHDYFDASQSVEMSRSLSVSGPVAEPPAVDPDLGTPVTADTVFAARRGAGESRAMNLVIVAGAAITLLLALGGMYYMLRTPAPVHTPSPAVAKGVERPAPDQRIVLPPVRPPDVNTVAGPVEAPAPASAAAAEPAGPAALETATAEPPTPAAPPPAPAVAASAPAPVPHAAAGPDPQRGSEPLRVAPAEIRITRGSGRPAGQSRVARAYEALNAGRAEEAEQLYRAILAAEPANRDARLALAALALQRGDREAAYDGYRAVQRLRPDDPIAAAALFALQGYRMPEGGESRLKLMLDRDPQAAYLHHVLGNYYARQQRWVDAEQSYFDAYSLRSDRADFALNLAVSLDHLGQREAALKYYRNAIDAADRQGSTFNTGPVLERIRALADAQAPP